MQKYKSKISLCILKIDYFASIIEDRFMTDIKNYVTNDYKAIDGHETIGAVRDFFDDLNFSHFPVIEEEIYIGSIAADDIETFDCDKKVSFQQYFTMASKFGPCLIYVAMNKQ